MGLGDILGGIADFATGGLGGAAIQGAGMIAGAISGSDSQDQANAAYQAAMKKIEEVGAPPDLAHQILLQEFKSAGVLTPQLEQAVGEEMKSKAAQITEDKGLRDAQMRSLETLQKTGRTGMTAQDRASLNQVRQEVQRDAEAKRQQILQNMQQRGMGGSGAELAAQLSAAQGGADQASAEGDRLAALSGERALNAIAQAGQLGGSIRGQDFGVAKEKATAEDEMNRFSTQNQIARQQRNIQAQNRAQEANLGNQQNIMNANTAQANQEKLRQNDAQRTYWQDKLNFAKAQVPGMDAQAGRIAEQGQNAAQGIQNIASGAAAALKENKDDIRGFFHPKAKQEAGITDAGEFKIDPNAGKRFNSVTGKYED